MKLRAAGIEIDLEEAFGRDPEQMTTEELLLQQSNNRLLRKILTATRRAMIENNKRVKRALIK